MNPEKFIELQQQMQENNREVADFLSDFGAWKKTVDAKNARLQNSEKFDTKLPAIRNSLLRKQRKKNEKAPLASKKAGDRIKAYDYQAWDKFDVDKALEEVDSVPSKESSTSETDEELENQRRINLAREARELGNLRFKVMFIEVMVLSSLWSVWLFFSALLLLIFGSPPLSAFTPD
ncbi:hypothetical protein AHF37_12845 [Paragonimus kellicotti]|nr:hypothetical protein AHF37_12845 [Paragonimus kellicotti]